MGRIGERLLQGARMFCMCLKRDNYEGVVDRIAGKRALKNRTLGVKSGGGN